MTFEEAGLIDFATGLDMHEKFLARLTVRDDRIQHSFTPTASYLSLWLIWHVVSSLNLLRIIAEEEKCSIEELNAGRVADWFTKDVERKNNNPEDAVLKW
eukprot:1191017-Prorocentrum_minimum.AAC.5